MRLAIIGISGFVGSHLLTESLARNHQVVGIYRRNKVDDHPQLKQVKMSVFETDQLKRVLKDVDCIISAYNPGYYHFDQRKRYLEAYDAIIKVTTRLKKRLIIVNGATSLLTKDGYLVKETYFNQSFINAQAGIDDVYDKYHHDPAYLITFATPAIELIDGTLTKQYQIGSNVVITDELDNSRISVQDFSDAIINEAERPAFESSRFTVGYQKSPNLK